MVTEITQLGLVTLKMNETVVTHDNYDFVTYADFEVEYKQNSDEEEQAPNYQITSITNDQIQVQLDFDKPILVSQG